MKCAEQRQEPDYVKKPVVSSNVVISAPFFFGSIIGLIPQRLVRLIVPLDDKEKRLWGLQENYYSIVGLLFRPNCLLAWIGNQLKFQVLSLERSNHSYSPSASSNLLLLDFLSSTDFQFEIVPPDAHWDRLRKSFSCVKWIRCLQRGVVTNKLSWFSLWLSATGHQGRRPDADWTNCESVPRVKCAVKINLESEQRRSSFEKVALCWRCCRFSFVQNKLPQSAVPMLCPLKVKGWQACQEWKACFSWRSEAAPRLYAAIFFLEFMCQSGRRAVEIKCDQLIQDNVGASCS